MPPGLVGCGRKPFTWGWLREQQPNGVVQAPLIAFDKNQLVAVGLADLRTQIALAIARLTGDGATVQRQCGKHAWRGGQFPLMRARLDPPIAPAPGRPHVQRQQ